MTGTCKHPPSPRTGALQIIYILKVTFSHPHWLRGGSTWGGPLPFPCCKDREQFLKSVHLCDSTQFLFLSWGQFVFSWVWTSDFSFVHLAGEGTSSLYSQEPLSHLLLYSFYVSTTSTPSGCVVYSAFSNQNPTHALRDFLTALGEPLRELQLKHFHLQNSSVLERFYVWLCG